MTLNRFSVTAKLEYSPESMDAFVTMCEDMIAYVTTDSSARFFLKNAVDEFTLNAIEHGYQRHSGDITVVLESYGSTIYCEISDHGVGIDPSKIKFDREAVSEADLYSRGWAMTILNRITNGIHIKPNQPCGAIISLSIPVPFNPS